MKLSIGIVGLPNVGKSTLFKALTKIDVTIANYPFATIDPNIGVVTVPDERLDKLAEISKSKKKIPAVVEFYDIAGLVKGASTGEGLGNQFLSHIREVQAIVHVVRCFEDRVIIHVNNHVNPEEDIETINTELILKDLETVEKRLHSAEKEAKSGSKEAESGLDILRKAKRLLQSGKFTQELNNEPEIKNLQLLTSKPMLYLLNGKQEEISSDEHSNILENVGMFSVQEMSYIVADLSNPNFDLAPLIKKAYEILDLISFFTTGEDETRAWTIKRGTLAPEAAGVIHTDFEKRFIRAEVISCADLIANGSWQIAKQKGLIRSEGKEYEVKDGDVMVVRHG